MIQKNGFPFDLHVDLLLKVCVCWGQGGEGLRFGCFSTQKPVSRPGWLKGKFALFQMLATGGWCGEQACMSKGWLPQPWWAGGENLYRHIAGGGGYMQKQHSLLWQSSSNWSSVVWPAWSWLFWVQISFSSRVPLFPFLCSQFSELWQLKSWVQSGHHVINFSTWCFGIYKTTHRIWLRILPIAPEKELKALDYA